MILKILEESTYQTARYGMLLSFGITSDILYVDFLNSHVLQTKADKVMNKLAGLSGGHDEFLKHMTVVLYTSMPIYWWSHFDQYQFSPDLSESKMHTILKQKLTKNNFSGHVDVGIIDKLNIWIEEKNFNKVIANLPSSFLQGRVVTTNYMTLRNIYNQRKIHKLVDWRVWCVLLQEKLLHSEFLDYKWGK